MNPIIFVLPESVESNHDGFNLLSFYAAETMAYVNQYVIFDFVNTQHFDGNLCAVLGSIIDGLKLRNNKVKLDRMAQNILGFMNRNGFLSHLDDKRVEYQFNRTTIHYEKFNVDDELGIQSYVETEVLGRAELPQMSMATKQMIVTSIFEVYINAQLHGQSEFVFSCGQIYPRRNPPTLSFTFVDLGKTVKNNVVEFTKRDMTAVEALIWASTDFNSTKTSNHNGGLGFKVIKDFILLNGGRVQIVSAEGCWEFHNMESSTFEMLNSFPGTIVNIVFNLTDKNKYYLASELKTKGNIF